MGNRFEIWVWHRGGSLEDYAWDYKQFWRGENLFVAMYKAWRAKQQGYGCVKIEWRGR